VPFQEINLIVGMELWRIFSEASAPVINLLQAIWNEIFGISNKWSEGHLKVSLFNHFAKGTGDQRLASILLSFRE
jgi:hypothetical protein